MSTATLGRTSGPQTAGSDWAVETHGLTKRFGLRARDRVSKYSMGMRQRLGVAACLIGDPQLLILDEPMNGLDPAGMQDMRELIRSFVAEGRTVMLSSHLLDEVERTRDAVAIVDRGRVIRQGSIAELGGGVRCGFKWRAANPTGRAHLSRRPISVPASTQERWG
jgi:ABC-type multidrug transport system ATPase subunit